MKQIVGVLLALLLVVSFAEETQTEFLKLYEEEPVQTAAGPWTNPTYNQDLAFRYLYAAETITCPKILLENWNCGVNCRNLPGFFLYQYYDHTTHLDNFTIPLAFDIIINNSTKEIIFGFRGTDSLVELYDEFTHFTGLPYVTDNFNVAGALVDRYFGGVYLNILHPIVMSNLQNLSKSYPDYQYTFTGHSLGGAMATLAAIDGATCGYIPVSQTSPQLYTFGSPRVGNWVFAEYVSNLIPVMFRIVHFNDLVPHVPLCEGEPVTRCLNNRYTASPFWAWHVKQEIFYNKDSSSYKVCSQTNSEDFSCSDSLTYVTWGAHLHYLNHSMFIC